MKSSLHNLENQAQPPLHTGIPALLENYAGEKKFLINAANLWLYSDYKGREMGGFLTRSGLPNIQMGDKRGISYFQGDLFPQTTFAYHTHPESKYPLPSLDDLETLIKTGNIKFTAAIVSLYNIAPYSLRSVAKNNLSELQKNILQNTNSPFTKVFSHNYTQLYVKVPVHNPVILEITKHGVVLWPMKGTTLDIEYTGPRTTIQRFSSSAWT